MWRNQSFIKLRTLDEIFIFLSPERRKARLSRNGEQTGPDSQT